MLRSGSRGESAGAVDRDRKSQLLLVELRADGRCRIRAKAWGRRGREPAPEVRAEADAWSGPPRAGVGSLAMQWKDSATLATEGLGGHSKRTRGRGCAGLGTAVEGVGAPAAQDLEPRRKNPAAAGCDEAAGSRGDPAAGCSRAVKRTTRSRGGPGAGCFAYGDEDPATCGVAAKRTRRRAGNGRRRATTRAQPPVACE